MARRPSLSGSFRLSAVLLLLAGPVAALPDCGPRAPWRALPPSPKMLDNEALGAFVQAAALVIRGLGAPEDWLLRLDQAYCLYAAAGDEAGAVNILGVQAIALSKLDREEEALALSLHVLERLQALGDIPQIVSVELSLAGSLLDAGKSGEALPYLQQALDTWTKKLGLPGDDPAAADTAAGPDKATFVLPKATLKKTEIGLVPLYSDSTVNDLGQRSDILVSFGDVFEELGQPAKALSCFQRAFELAEMTGNFWRRGTILSRIGRLQNDQGRSEEAFAAFEQALRDARFTTLSTDQEAEALLGIAETHRARREHPLALKYYGEVLTLLPPESYPNLHGLVLLQRGGLQLDMGSLDEAEISFRKSLDIYRAQGQPGRQALALFLLASLQLERGSPERALTTLEEVLSLLRQNGLSKLPPYLQALRGAVLIEIGLSEEGLRDLEAAVAGYRLERDLDSLGVALYNLGVAYYRIGQLGKALQILYEALDLRTARRDLPGMAEDLSGIAAVLISSGQTERAVGYLQQALDLHHQLTGFPAARSLALTNLGILLAVAGEHARALEALSEALQLGRALGPDSPLVARALSVRGGELYARLGDSAKALQDLEQALGIYRRMKNWNSIASTLQEIGTQLAIQGKVDKAVDSLEEALEIQEKDGDLLSQTETLLILGQVYEQKGMIPDEVLDLYRRAVAARERLRVSARADDLKMTLAAQSDDVYDMAILKAFDLGRGEEAFDLAERSRARTLLDALGSHALPLVWEGASDLARTAQSLQNDLRMDDQWLRAAGSRAGGPPGEAKLAEVIARRDQHRKDLEETLSRMALEKAPDLDLFQVATVPLQEIQRRLDGDTALLAYHLGKKRALAFVVTRNSFRAVELPLKTAEIRRVVWRFRQAPLWEDPEPVLGELYRGLVAPVRDDLGKRRVGIIPDGDLFYLPFAAAGEKGKLLGDELSLFYLPSASLLPRELPAPAPDTHGILALGVGEVQGARPLHQAREEAIQVAAVSGARPLLDGEATESALKARAGDHKIVHVAAHGELSAARPLFSRLLLEPSPGEDGALEVHEVYGLSLRGVDLVTLSACRTDALDSAEGGDIVGLTHAFLRSGAASVLASLWTVDDTASGELMVAFYRELAQGRTKIESLRHAQSAIRGKYPHPYYWAGFLLVGRPE